MIPDWIHSLAIIFRQSKPRPAPGRNHRHRHRLRLRLESLESRELLAATPGSMPIGAGLDALTYYSETSMFKDVMKMSKDGWDVVEAASPTYPWSISGVPEPAMDSNGYPIGLGNLPSQGYALDTYVFTGSGQNYPTGIYTLTFDGDGTVEIINGNLPPQVFSQAGGSGSPSDVYINSTVGSGIVIVITSSNASDYVDNIRLVMPGFQDSYLTQPFNPAFLSELEPFQQVRVMGLMGLNNLTGQNVGLTWANETPVTYRTQTKSTGVSVQYLVELANVLQENLWVNMPVGADSSFLTDFSQYVEQNLDSNLKVYVEYGNEVWNSNYSSEYNYVLQYAEANNLNFPQATAVLATATWNVWLQSFSGQTNRVLRVLANQLVINWSYNQEIEELVKISSPNDPDHGFDVVSGAGYFGPDTSSYNAQTTVQQIESDSMAALTTLQSQFQTFMSMVTGWSSTLDQNIPVILYEGGLGLDTSSSNVPWWNAFVAAQTDSGMYSVMLTFFEDIEAAGIAGINFTDLVFPTSMYGEWGLMNYIGEPSSLTPKYNAMLAFINSQGTSLAVDDESSTVVAGTASSITVTAYNSDGSVDTGYTGTVSFSSSDPDASLPSNYTFTSADAGVHTFSVTLDTVELQSVSVTDSTNGLYGVQWSISVQPAQATSLAVGVFPSTLTAGASTEANVWALDPYGNIATGYTGTVAFTSSDPQAILPSNTTFTTGDLGMISPYVVFGTAGVQSLTATDTSTSSITGTDSSTTIVAGPVAQLEVTGFPSPADVGTAYNFVVTACDTYGNLVSSYTGTVAFSSSDPNASLPASYTFTSSDAGTHTFAATLVTAGTQSLTATDETTSSVTGTDSGITVQSLFPSASKLTLTGFPTSVTAGVASNFTITAYDQYGNIDIGYTGTVKFTSTDSQASLPSNYTFTSKDAGVHTFSATLKTVGTRSITGTDTSDSSVTSTESGIAVAPSSAKSLVVGGFASPVNAGTASSFTVKAYDPYGNLATGYTGTVTFTSTDSQASLPSNYTFTSSDAGVHTFSATLKTAGSQSITATDTGNSSVTGTESAITVKPVSASKLTLGGFPNTVTAGVASSFTVTAYDQYGNVATGYTGTVKFTSSDSQASLPSNYTFVSKDAGVHTFSASLGTVGTQSITGTDTGNSSLTSTESGITVTPSTAASLVLTGFPSPAVAGAYHGLTVTAYDPYGNVATGYTGTVTFTSSDSQASLPADYTFVSKDAGKHNFSGVYLATVGTQSITGTDTGNSSLTSTESGITVQPGAAWYLIFGGFPNTVTAGTAASFTITATDEYGNVATGFTNMVKFTSTDSQASLPSNYTFTSNDAGVHTFSGTLKTAGSQSITSIDVNDSNITGADSGITVQPAAASTLTLSGFQTPVTAGTASSFTVTAYDPYGNLATAYTGTVKFTSTDSQASLPSNYTFVSKDAGVHTFSGTLKTAGTQSITGTDTSNSSVTGTESAITVTPSTAASLTLTGFPSPATAGTAYSLTVTAYDQYGNVATGYTGTVKFTSTDPQAVLPSNYMFVSKDAGKHAFSATLETASAQSITGTDTSDSSLTSTESGITVRAASASKLTLGGFPNTVIAGTASSFTVTAYDPYGNVATGFTNTVKFTSTDSQASLPSNYKFTSSDAGVHTFSGTLETAGTQSITGTATSNSSLTSTESGITVKPTTASKLTLGGFPTPVTAGTASSFTVTAYDPYGNVATGYTGTVMFTSTDSQASLPSNYTFTSGDAGVHTFSATLETAGTQSITGTDTSNSGLNSTESGITVTPSTAASLTLSGFPSPATAGKAHSVTVTAYDQYGNVATGYTGTVMFTSTDSQAVLPADYTFVSNDAGKHTFSSTKLETVGTQSITGTDTSNSGLTSTESGITVQPASASKLTLSGFPNTVTAGVAANFTVTAYDPYGNVATGYTGTVKFTSTDSQASLPSNYTFTSGDAGVHTFSGTLDTAGTQSIIGTDTSKSSLTSAESGITVQPTTASKLTLGGFPNTVTAGVASSFTVTAYDPYGNVATGYTGTVKFTSSDSQASLSSNYTFTSDDAGVHTFSGTLGTAGTQAITGTDTSNSSLTSTESGITVTPSTAASLVVTGFPSPVVAGAYHGLTVTAYDPYGNVATGYTGTVTFTSSDSQASLPADYTFVSQDAGKHNFSGVYLATAGTQSITGTDTGDSSLTSTESGITVQPGAAWYLIFGGFPNTVTAGTAASFTITATDEYGNVATGFTNMVKFISTDSQASLPSNYTFTSNDAGVHTFSGTLKTAGSQSITSIDVNDSNITGADSGITVQPAAASTLTLSGFQTPVTAGTASSFTVTADDPYGNVATAYTGTVSFTSTDWQASLPSDYTFVSEDAGVHTFSGTLKTAGTQSITGTDTSDSSVTGTESAITVTPSTAASLALTGFPNPATAGADHSLIVTAYDPYGNVATGYTGTVKFTSTDPQAVLPSNYMFVSKDAGKHTFSATLETAGAQSITGTDTSDSSLTSTESGITVRAASASKLTLGGFPNTVIAGTASSFTVTAYDPYGNVATGFTNTVKFTSTDSQASLPSNYKFTSGDAGVHTFSGTLETAGTQSITGTATSNSSLTSTESGITVKPTTASKLTLGGFPTTVTAGTASSFTVTAYDPYGNVATGYTGTVKFTSTDSQASLPSNYTFTSGDAGVHTFSATLETAGTQSITGTDTSNSGLNSTESGIAVTPSTAASLTLSGFPSPATAGKAHSFTVTAYDQYGNVATGYTGTVKFTSTDSQAVLPADYTFVSNDAGKHTFSSTKLETVGTQSITGTDTSNSGLTSTESGITVQPDSASKLTLSGFPNTVTAGVASSFTVTAYDPYGNVATGYTGTVKFTSTDSQASLPSNYTFTSGDAGVHTFSGTLETAGTQSIIGTDTSKSSLTSAESGITVQPTTASKLTLGGFPNTVTAGVASSFTVTAYDPYGNVATGYTGTVSFTSSDSQASLSSNYTFTSDDAGVHTFSGTLGTAGTQAITGTDTSNSSLTSTESGITVTPSTAASLVVTGFPSPVVAGAYHGLTVTAYDPYGNVATGYTGTVTFTSSDSQASLPADYTFVSQDAGKHNFSGVYLATAGTQSITGTDTGDSSLTSTESGITVQPGAAWYLIFGGFPNTVTAGTAASFTITATDEYGNVTPAFTDTVKFGSTDSQASLPSNYTFTSNDAGVHTFSATLKTAGSQSITSVDVNDSNIKGTESAITVQTAATSELAVSGFPNAVNAGTASSFTVTAYDPYGNVTTGYTGTVDFTSTDSQASLPSNYTFTSNDVGVHTFSGTLKTAGAQSITSTDTGNSSITGTESGIAVAPLSATSLALTGFPSPVIAGADHALIVTAYDQYGNVATSYTGTVKFTSTDPQAVLPSSYMFVSKDAGQHTFSNTALETAGTRSITGTDTSNSGLNSTESGITVQPGQTWYLAVTGFPSPVTAGTAANFTVTATDEYGNVTPTFTDTVKFTSTDSQASLPSSYTFTSNDAGVHTFSGTLKTAGTQSITAIDVNDSNITGTQSGINVQPAGDVRLAITGLPSKADAGKSYSFTVTAYDQYGNVATGYIGTVQFSSSDDSAQLPSNYTFTSSDKGSHQFSVTFKTKGNQTLTVADHANNLSRDASADVV